MNNTIAPEIAEHHDPLAARIGMWAFLFSEALLFGTMFIGFAVYLKLYRWDFEHASRELDKLVGAGNTLILLTSSLTMALAIGVFARGRKKLALALLGATLACALAFLAIKSYEWGHKFDHGLYPKSAVMMQRPVGEQLFYGFYFAMAGLHALHVIAGSLAIVFCVTLIHRGKVVPGRAVFLENTGLYWHLVDVIWIFLFPLFYLIGGAR